VADPRYAAAADVIISATVDRFFREPWTFEDIAKALGFNSLATSVEAEEGREELQAFFRAVCASPSLTGSDAVRWSGRGWKLIAREHETTLSELWRRLCDEAFVTSRRCSEQDWKKLMRLARECELEVRAHGQHKLAVRFIAYTTRKNYCVNEELYEANDITQPPDLPGLRDAVSPPDLSGGDRVHTSP
jgi:hypothetical protein